MKPIEKEQVLAVIRCGEFGDDIIRSADRVAVILTQSWCPQWQEMQRFLSGFSETEIYVLEYDRSDCFDAFRRFKEQVFGNDLIPYIRYYSRGTLVAESNAVSREAFQRYLNEEIA